MSMPWFFVGTPPISPYKQPIRGLMDRQAVFTSGYHFGGCVAQVNWAQFQPTSSADAIAGSAGDTIMQAAIAGIRAYNLSGNYPYGYSLGLKLRLYCGGVGWGGTGQGTPGWALNLDPVINGVTMPAGGIPVVDIASNPHVYGLCPPWWGANFQTAYLALQLKLVAIYDPVPEVRENIIAMMATIYSEPMVRQPPTTTVASTTVATAASAGATKLDLVGLIQPGQVITVGSGGTAETRTVLTSTNPSSPYTITFSGGALANAHSVGELVTGGAVVAYNDFFASWGLTTALDVAAMNAAVDIHKTAWAPPAGSTLQCLSMSVYAPPEGGRKRTDIPDTWESYARAQLGPQFIAGNNSADSGTSMTGNQGKMWKNQTARGPQITHQTHQASTLGLPPDAWYDTAQQSVDLGATSMELPTAYDGANPGNGARNNWPAAASFNGLTTSTTGTVTVSATPVDIPVASIAGIAAGHRALVGGVPVAYTSADTTGGTWLRGCTLAPRFPAVTPSPYPTAVTVLSGAAVYVGWDGYRKQFEANPRASVFAA
jgi:hypothetical protein